MNFESKITTVLLSNSKPIPPLLKAKEYTTQNINLEDKYMELFRRACFKLKQEEFIHGTCIQIRN